MSENDVPARVLKCVCECAMLTHSHFCLSGRWYPPLWLDPLPLRGNRYCTACRTALSILHPMIPDTIPWNSFCLQSQHNANANQRNSFASGIDSRQRPRQKKKKPTLFSLPLFQICHCTEPHITKTKGILHNKNEKCPNLSKGKSQTCINLRASRISSTFFRYSVFFHIKRKYNLGNRCNGIIHHNVTTMSL